MALYLPIRPISRSQNVRIGGEHIKDVNTTYYVDISDGKTRRELQHHQAIGAVIVVGPLTDRGELPSGVVSEERTFTETTGAGVYTGSVVLPAGATLVDIIVTNEALWTAQTSATLKVGDDDDDDGFFAGVDLKATDLLAGQSLSLAATGGKEGAYLVPGADGDENEGHINGRYSADERTISGIVTKVGSTGTAGRTRMTVIYSLPQEAHVEAATKV